MLRKSLFIFLTFFLLYSKLIFSSIDTQLLFISNTYNSPSSGIATLVFDVQAKSNIISFPIAINNFQDAIQLDSNFQSQIQKISFSNENFDSTSYTVQEQYDSVSFPGRISYTYSFKSGTRGSVGYFFPTSIVTITIQYTMSPTEGSVSWFSGSPEYQVTDSRNSDITGTEQNIPADFVNIPLPVELSSFTAVKNNSSIELNWQTKTEVNNYGFEIERRTDNSLISTAIPGPGSSDVKWIMIGFVKGNGNSNSPENYSFVDKYPEGGSNFIYRLKQIDNTGSYNYSKEIKIKAVPAGYNLYQNYPNPFNPSTTIKFNLPQTGEVKIEVFDITGKKLSTIINQSMNAGFHSVIFNTEDLSNKGRSFSSGTYIYRLTAPGFSSARKMILLK
jgi:hypothetical protein